MEDKLVKKFYNFHRVNLSRKRNALMFCGLIEKSELGQKCYYCYVSFLKGVLVIFITLTFYCLEMESHPIQGGWQYFHFLIQKSVAYLKSATGVLV